MDRVLEPLNLSHYTGSLIHNYGRQSDQILKSLSEFPQLEPEQQLLVAEFIFCSNYEMSVSPEDFWLRRTGRGYFNPSTVKLLDRNTLQNVKQIKLLNGSQLAYWESQM
jgi:glycerol-3-phosphate dehydrogenase